jgi:hypothetical protein
MELYCTQSSIHNCYLQLFEHTYNLYSFSNTTGASYLFRFQNSTASTQSKFLPYIPYRYFHSNVFVWIVVLLWKWNKSIVMSVSIVTLLWKCNRVHRSCYQGNLICNNILQRYYESAKNYKFCTVRFSDCPNITSEFCIIVIFRSFVKQNNDPNKTWYVDNLSL